MAAAGETEYSCECPTNSTETGVDLYDNSSTDLACNVGHNPPSFLPIPIDIHFSDLHLHLDQIPRC